MCSQEVCVDDVFRFGPERAAEEHHIEPSGWVVVENEPVITRTGNGPTEDWSVE